MMSSKNLKSFVKMHENKLNAKMNGLRTSHIESEIERDTRDNHSVATSASQHWNLPETDQLSRRRPKSRYFNFILTTTH